jgi:hypothetical protein
MKNKVTKIWGKWHKKELHDLLYSPNITWVDEIGGAFTTHGGDEKSILKFCQKTWREALGTPTLRLEKNIKMELEETVCKFYSSGCNR